METGYIKIIQEDGKTPSVEAKLINSDLLLTVNEMARLFNCYVMKINANLRSIFKSHLLVEKDCSFCNRYSDRGIEKQTIYYNLETLIFLSYRINSFEAKIFRQFVNTSLREYLQKKKKPEIKLFWTYLPNKNNYWLN